MKKLLKFIAIFLIIFGLVFVIEKYQQIKIQEQQGSNQSVGTDGFSSNTDKGGGEEKADYQEKLKKISVEEQEVPLPKGIKRVKFEWEYKGQNYVLEDVLYDNIYSFYQNQPKVFQYTGSLPQNWENEYYGIFLKSAHNDDSIEDLAVQLETLAQKNNLNENETVEMVVAFVQDIPYDNDKADGILEGLTDIKPRYPYEVLYENLGVCSGKSFLLVAILRQLEFGAALLEYSEQNHMAVGIQCPKEYSIDKASGYCYTETTTFGHKIGIIPQINLDENSAVVEKEKDYIDSETEIIDDNIVKPDKARIFQQTKGKEYTGVIETFKKYEEQEMLENEINELKVELKNTKEELDRMRNQIDELNQRLSEYEENNETKKYNKLVPQYNELLNELKAKVDQYNGLVSNYNQKVEEYNNLRKEF
ncbi:MAG: hypothetical protein GF347_01230 [Candidatus Moranbacteria bacterium]|nr:hypothetical protein [Candidatus Moranbacteria bacterium]